MRFVVIYEEGILVSRYRHDDFNAINFAAGHFSRITIVRNFCQCRRDGRRVACVGDSITFGMGLRDRDANAYPVRLGKWLGADYDVRNFCVSATTLLRKGDKPYIKEKTYSDAINFKPDILVIDLGANDSKHPGDGSLDADNAVDNWRHKDSYISDYKEIIAAFRKVNVSVKVFVCLPSTDYPGRWGINDKTIRDEMIPDDSADCKGF